MPSRTRPIASRLTAWHRWGLSPRSSRTSPTAQTRPRLVRLFMARERSLGISLPSGSVFDCETSCREFLDWREGHTAAEGMERLGLSRSTYFRRLRAIRERATERDRVNAERAGNSEGRHLPPVTYRLVDTR